MVDDVMGFGFGSTFSNFQLYMRKLGHVSTGVRLALRCLGQHESHGGEPADACRVAGATASRAPAVPRHGAAAGLFAEPNLRQRGQCVPARAALEPAAAQCPEFGKCNAAIAVRANFFALKYPKDVVLYDYPVVDAPDVVSAAIRKRVFKLLESMPEVAPYLHEIAHDWTQRLVSRSRLPADFSATVLEGSERVYTLKTLEHKELRAADLDRVGLEAWKGFFASVRPVYKKLMVNISVCMGTFARIHCTGQAALRASYRVTTKHLGYCRKSRIKAFGSQSARKTVFQCAELGGMVSVEQYFQQNFNIRLQHADNFSVINVGNKMKDIFVPAELYEIEPGQPFADMLSGSEAAEMAKYSTNPPYINAKAITEQGIGILGLHQCAPPIQGFGIEFSVDMAVGSARLLSPPKLAPLTGATFSVLADKGCKDFRDSSDPALRGVVTRFPATCLAGRMQVDDALPLLLFTFPGCPNIILVFASIIEIYPGLKKKRERSGSIPLEYRAQNQHEAWRCQPPARRELKSTILIGMDLTHPGVGCVKGTPSIAAIVANCDKNYPASLGLQEHGKEASNVFDSIPTVLLKQMTTGVKQMLIERLNEYLKHMKTLPERVVVFRVIAVYSFDFFLQAHVGQQGRARRELPVGACNEERVAGPTGVRGGTSAPASVAIPARSIPAQDPSASAGQQGERHDEAPILRRAKELWGTGVHENLRVSMFYFFLVSSDFDSEQ
ncbi:Piwi-domain-containing protein [Phellopilus nigrolimitatus]|nr:Piwi-domain-containing protein [Phellopilus nigrolimitatus]